MSSNKCSHSESEPSSLSMVGGALVLLLIALVALAVLSGLLGMIFSQDLFYKAGLVILALALTDCVLCIGIGLIEWLSQE